MKSEEPIGGHRRVIKLSRGGTALNRLAPRDYCTDPWRIGLIRGTWNAEWNMEWNVKQ